MKKISAITDDAKQVLNLVLEDSSKVAMNINYIPSQTGWFYSMSYGTSFLFKNKRLVNSPNMLRQFRNIIPFGLACTVIDGYEPVYQNDFTSGRVSLFLLNATEVAQVETLIIVTIPTFIGYPLD